MTPAPPARLTSDDLIRLVIEALEDLDQAGPAPDGAPIGPETPLFGREGLLDSLGLVTLVVAVERALEDRFGVQVSLADDRAMSQTQSPFRTVRSLAEYATRLVSGHG